jgi:hypothetical protein
MNYIANEDTIIFSTVFNDKLNPGLLLGYKKIIFSDNELNEKLFEAYEKNNFDNTKFIGSQFNQPLSNSLDDLTHLTFGGEFNQPLSNSLSNLINLTHLTFGFIFNQLPIKFKKFYGAPEN